VFQLSGKRIFITGLAGFLGSHIADRCLAEGYRVSGCDNLTGGYLDNVPSGAVFHQIDCNDFALLAALMREVDMSIIVLPQPMRDSPYSVPIWSPATL